MSVMLTQMCQKEKYYTPQRLKGPFTIFELSSSEKGNVEGLKKFPRAQCILTVVKISPDTQQMSEEANKAFEMLLTLADDTNENYIYNTAGSDLSVFLTPLSIGAGQLMAIC